MLAVDGHLVDEVWCVAQVPMWLQLLVGIHRVNVLLLIMGYMGEENPSLSNKYIIRLAGVFFFGV